MTTGNLSIQDNDTVDQYVSVGESVFGFNFPVLESADLKVSIDQVPLTYGTDYTIAGLGDEGGGEITLLGGASTPGQIVTLWLDLPIKRLTGFTAGAATILPTDLNDEFIQRTRTEQMLRREIRNAIRLPPDDSIAGQDMELAPIATRGGKLLGFAPGGGLDYTLQLAGSTPLSRSIIGGLLNPLTGTESGLPVTPADFAYPEDDVDRYSDADAPTVYLELVSALKGGWKFDALRAIPKSKWAAMRDYTSTYDAQPQLALLFGDMTSARRTHLYVSDGLWNLGAPLTNIPLRLHMEGSGRRSTGGVGAASALWSGTCFKATFNTGAPFQIVEAGLTVGDVLLEHFGIYGTGTGANIDGIQITNIAGYQLRHMIIDHFTRYGLNFTGGNYGVFEDIYSARNAQAPYYINGELCTMKECSADAGMVSVLVGALGYGLELSGRCHFEGPAQRCLQVAGNQFTMMGGTLVPTIGTFPAWSGATTYYVGQSVSHGGVKYMCLQMHLNQEPPNATYWYPIVAGCGGAKFTANRWALIGTELRGGYVTNPQASYGIESDTTCERYRCVGVQVGGFSTAAILREGLGAFVGNTLSGEDTGLELVGGSYVGVIDGNHIAGVNHSIKHTSGNGKWIIGPSNRLSDAAAPQTHKPMTVTAGFPIVHGNLRDASAPTVPAAADLQLPYDTEVVIITGNTTINTINAGGMLNRTYKLIFTGAPTVTDNASLQLAGGVNFVASANDVLVITCPDGATWYEAGRSVN